MIVVDASAVARMLVDSPADTELGRLFASNDLHAPTLLDYEIASVLRGHALGGLVSDDRLGEAIQDFEALSIERHSMTSGLASILALRDNFTVYDAAYVVLALALDIPLVTADAKHLEAVRLGLDVRLVANT